MAGYINTCLRTPTFLKRLLKSLVFQNQQEILGVKILKNRKIPMFSGKILIKIDTAVLMAGRAQSLIIRDLTRTEDSLVWSSSQGQGPNIYF